MGSLIQYHLQAQWIPLEEEASILELQPELLHWRQPFIPQEGMEGRKERCTEKVLGSQWTRQELYQLSFYFETGFHVEAGLKFALELSLTLNSWSPRLSLPNAGKRALLSGRVYVVLGVDHTQGSVQALWAS